MEANGINGKFIQVVVQLVHKPHTTGLHRSRKKFVSYCYIWRAPVALQKGRLLFITYIQDLNTGIISKIKNSLTTPNSATQQTASRIAFLYKVT